jgi:type VI secretion system protein ImpK
MRQEIARTVYPVLRHGLLYKERLERGERLRLPDVQSELRARLKLVPEPAERQGAAEAGDAYFGSRYALACWLDEIFIDSPWKDAWTNSLLEWALYDSREAAHKFWDQARQAELRADADALEVFYLCVMLGFRGDLQYDLERLAEWKESVQGQFGQDEAETWPDAPAELPPLRTNVPALRGRERLRWVLLAFAVVAGLSIMAVTFLIVKQ